MQALPYYNAEPILALVNRFARCRRLNLLHNEACGQDWGHCRLCEDRNQAKLAGFFKVRFGRMDAKILVPILPVSIT